MEIYLYLDKNTLFHRLHPITKIFSLLLLFVLALIFTHPLYVLAITIIVLIIGGLSKTLSNLIRIKTILILLIVFCSILWTFFIKGTTVLWQLGALTVYKESMLHAIAMGLRFDTVLVCGMIFLSCTKIEEFTAGLNKLGMPFPLSFALSLAFRLVPTFSSTTATVIQAQKSRGLDLESGWILQRIKKYVPLLVPIFIYAIRNADLLAMALESKSFGIRKNRTYYQQFKVTFADYFAIIFLIILNAICIYIRYTSFSVS